MKVAYIAKPKDKVKALSELFVANHYKKLAKKNKTYSNVSGKTPLVSTRG